MKNNNSKTVIQHSIPGRLRLRVPLSRWSPETRSRFENELAGLPGVRWTRLNAKGNSVIVRYDLKVLTLETLITRLSEFFPLIPSRVSAPGGQSKKQGADPRRSELGSAQRRFVGLTVLAAGVLFRRVVLRLGVAQTLFSPLGVITVLAALPLVKSGLEDLRQKRLSLESFLGGGIITAVAAGEASGRP